MKDAPLHDRLVRAEERQAVRPDHVAVVKVTTEMSAEYGTGSVTDLRNNCIYNKNKES